MNGFFYFYQMINTSFLGKIATVIIQEYSTKIVQTTIVLPNKRAKVFLIEALKNETEHTMLSPEIISIEDFVQDVASVRSIDAIELLFEFYKVYLSVTEKQNQQ